MVPNLLAPGTSFMEDNFPTDRGWGEGDGFRMIQVHHIYSSAHFISIYFYFWASLVAQMVKSLTAMRRPGFNPWAGRAPGEGNGHHQFLAWRIP